MTNNNEAIKFSVLIPVYNVEEYIQECLESVLNQTYTNFEVILTNDGSTDKSGEICTKHASLDDRVSIYHQENQGLLMARRTSIAYSTGDYCMFLDSDDSWKLDTLEIIYNTIKETQADLVMFNWDRMQGDKFISSKPLFKDKEIFSGDEKKQIIDEFISTNKVNSLCLKAVKTSILDKKKIIHTRRV